MCVYIYIYILLLLYVYIYIYRYTCLNVVGRGCRQRTRKRALVRVARDRLSPAPQPISSSHPKVIHRLKVLISSSCHSLLGSGGEKPHDNTLKWRTLGKGRLWLHPSAATSVGCCVTDEPRQRPRPLGRPAPAAVAPHGDGPPSGTLAQ